MKADYRRGLDIAIPMLPTSLNKWTRSHWTVRNRERKAWDAALGAALLIAGCRKGRPLWAGPVTITLVYRFAKRKNGKYPDLDNLAPKHVIDGLRGWVFPDDGPSYVPRLVQSVEHGCDRDETAISIVPLESPVFAPQRPLMAPEPSEPRNRLEGKPGHPRKRGTRAGA